MRVNGLVSIALFAILATNGFIFQNNYFLAKRLKELERTTASITRVQQELLRQNATLTVSGNALQPFRLLQPHALLRPSPPPAAQDAAVALPESNRDHPVAAFQTIKRQFSPPSQETLLQIPLARAYEAGKVYTEWDRHRSPPPVFSGISKWTGPPITSIRVWGERHSCTTLFTNLLQKQFPNLGCKIPPCVGNGLPWKHTFLRRRSKEVDDENTLHVLITKHPYDWLQSMEKLPFHAGFHTLVGIENLLGLEWMGFVHGVEELGGINDDFMKIANSAQSVLAKPRAADPAHLDPCTLFGDTAVEAEQCSVGGVLHTCTVVPAAWAMDDAQTPPVEGCLSASQSRAHCGTGYLCRHAAKRLWESDPDAWRQAVLRGIERRYGVAYPEARAPLTAQDSCAVVREGRAVAVDCLAPPQGAQLYACRSVPGVLLVNRESEAAMEACLGGRFSWGTCREGKWLCEAGVAVEQVAVRKGRVERMNAEKVFVKEFLRSARSIPLVGPWLPFETVEERDQDTGRRFPNVLALRTAKLRDWMAASAQLKATAHLQCRDLMLDRDAAVQRLAAAFGLARANSSSAADCAYIGGSCHKHIDPSAGKAQSLQGGHMAKYSQHTLPIVNAWLDPEVEAALGYVLHDDLLRAATAYNASTRCALHLPRAWRERECR